MASKEELRKLMLAMNPDAEQIEEAAAAAPKVPAAAKALGKGFYEANIAPFLSPEETAKAIFGAGREFVKDPKAFGEAAAKSELERLKAASEKPEAAAEYAGSFLSPFSMLRRMPNRSEIDAYHASPAKFKSTADNPLGEFDITKMGSGIGQQQRGPGTYIAEMKRAANRFRLAPGSGDLSKGFMYTVDLPDSMIEKMLDLDAPIMNQPKIRETLLKIADDNVLPQESADYLRYMLTSTDETLRKYPLTGQGLVAVPRELGGIFRDNVEANTVLQRYGIPGSKWDAGLFKEDIAKGREKASRNFVVFPGEEKKVKILEREGGGERVKSTPVKRAAGSPPEGETSASQEELRRLIRAMNPDSEQIEEAVAAAPQVPATAKALGKGFYEANVEPLLSPYDTAMAIFGAGKEFVSDPKEFSQSVARAEMERLRAAGDKPEAAAEYYGGLLSPFSMLRRLPKSEVVRPKGQGIVLDYPDAPLVPIGNKDPGLDEAYGTTRFPKGFVNRTIEDGREQLKTLNARGGVTLDQSVAIDDFLRTKVRNYFVNQFGTKDDPIFKAIKEGRLSTTKLREPGGIREYLPVAAKEGKTRVNPETGQSTFYPTRSAQQALEDINKIYDDMTGMRGTVIANRTVGNPKNEYGVLDEERAKSQQLLEDTREALIAEGGRPDEINPSMGLLGYKDPAFAANLPPGKKLSDVVPIQGRRRTSSASPDVAALMLAQSGDLPKSLRTAIEKGQPIYDMNPSGALDYILAPEPLVDYLATLSPREIKNLRYEDAVRGAVKLNELATQRKAVLERIREGKPVDNKIFMEGVSAPLVSYSDKTQFPGFTWRQITDPEATAVEGAYIGHSVGGYAKEGTYSPDNKKAFRSGETKVYTLRDAEGKPVTTVEVKEITGRGPIVTQVKGAGKKTGNSGDKTPYDSLLVDLFSTLNVAGVTEYNLPPLAKAYQAQREAATRVQLRGALGAPQPIGAPQQPAPPRPAPPAAPQQGIGQLPGAPQNLPNEGFIQQMLRRLQGDQD